MSELGSGEQTMLTNNYLMLIRYNSKNDHEYYSKYVNKVLRGASKFRYIHKTALPKTVNPK